MTADPSPVPAAPPASEDVTLPAPTVRPPRRLLVDLGRPFTWGLLATLGALTGLALGGAASALSSVWVYIGVALFLAMALDPLVVWLQGHRMSRGLAITVVFAGFAVLFGILLAIVVPIAVNQIVSFAQATLSDRLV